MKKSYLVLSVSLLAITTLSQAAPRARSKSLCTSVDLRQRTYDPKVARARLADEPAGCTVTMIGRACAISAGHCTETFELAEFNLPDKKSIEESVTARAEETYQIDADSVVSRNAGPGADWAVLRLLKNEKTGQLAGDVQGFYAVSFAKVEEGETVTIKGHGFASDPLLSFSQLGHTGKIVSAANGLIEHRVDTTGGSSGSSIVRASDQTIIGVHTHGGCYPTYEPILAAGGSSSMENFFGFFDFFDMPNANAGTEIHGSKDLQEAIDDCLAWELDHLEVVSQQQQQQQVN